jgi:glycosyltransferase involved in cell wall biosynthesis
MSVLVNGAPGSPAAERARELFSRSELVRDGRVRLNVRHRSRFKAAEAVGFLGHLMSTRPAVVYVVDLAAAAALPAVIYRLLSRRSKLVIDTGDAITSLARKLGTRGRIGMLATAALERIGHWAADKLVVRGSGHILHLGRHATKAVVVQDGVDVCAHAAVRPIAAEPPFTHDAPLVVGVLGSLDWNPSLHWCYGAELVEAMRYLPDDLAIRGTIVGDGSGLAHLRDRVNRWGMGYRVDFVGRVPPDQIPAVLGTMHVALSTQTNDLVGQVRTTGKLPLYLAAGRFVLASRVGEAARLLPEAMLIDYEGSFDPNYPKRLAQTLARLAVDRPYVAAVAAVGPTLAQTLDYAVLAERLDNDVLIPMLNL